MQTGPVFISSGDLIADRRYQWALDYLARGDQAGAAEIFEQVLETAPAFAAAWFWLGAVREAQGDRERAVAAFAAARDADPPDYHGARLRLARLGVGEVTSAMMQLHVRRLFDQHAPRFDQSLLQHLDYRAPQLLHQAVTAMAQSGGSPPRFAAMLDLGCGTGLAGAAFRAAVDRLTGIDLSTAMIDEARRKALYDRLETGELAEFLNAEAAARARYDLVLAADVLVYIEDLASVAAAVRRVLAPSGLFGFTLETHAGDGALLRESLRYAHGAAHVRAAMANAGLELDHLAEVSTRTEKGEPVPGLLGVATAC
ncbi:MAG TPA: methyltransferase [Xanthobacteraceae bacterium]|nr:methyltransferase [Xanthobacteraceae bacterium]